MKQPLIQLAAAIAIGIIAAGAQAQYTSPAPRANPPGSPDAGVPATAGSTRSNADPRTKADADYRAALARCNDEVGLARKDCVRAARAEYDRAVGQINGFDSQTGPAMGLGGAGAAGGTGGMSGNNVVKSSH